MRSEEGGYERDGRIKVRPPTSDGHSGSNTRLNIDYHPMDVSNDTKTTAIRPLMPPPLSPSPDTNIDPYRACQAERTPFLRASPIVDMGGSRLSSPFFLPDVVIIDDGDDNT